MRAWHVYWIGYDGSVLSKYYISEVQAKISLMDFRQREPELEWEIEEIELV